MKTTQRAERVKINNWRCPNPKCRGYKCKRINTINGPKRACVDCGAIRT